MGRHPVALAGMGLVFLLFFTLAFGVVLRPWSTPNTSWQTHLNVRLEAPQGYARSVPSYVGSAGALAVWRQDPRASVPPGEEGRALFAAFGCASCHGVDAEGSGFAPLEADSADYVRLMARSGPGGMPAFTESELSEEHLNTIASWVVAQVAQRGPKPTATPTPMPPTATPTATPSAEPTPIPAETTRTPTPEAPSGSKATPTPTPSPVVLKGDGGRGEALFAEKKCANCHGKGGKGTGIAPALDTAEFAQKFPGGDAIAQIVRQGKGAMPGFDGARMTDQELLDIIAYLRSLGPQ